MKSKLILIPGFARTGSTSLYKALIKNNNIRYSSLKEVNYDFNLDFSLEKYVGLFDKGKGNIYLDPSVDILYRDIEYLKKISILKKYFDVYVIILDRNPIEKMVSHYQQDIAKHFSQPNQGINEKHLLSLDWGGSLLSQFNLTRYYIQDHIKKFKLLTNIFTKEKLIYYFLENSKNLETLNNFLRKIGINEIDILPHTNENVGKPMYINCKKNKFIFDNQGRLYQLDTSLNYIFLVKNSIYPVYDDDIIVKEKLAKLSRVQWDFTKEYQLIIYNLLYKKIYSDLFRLIGYEIDFKFVDIKSPTPKLRKFNKNRIKISKLPKQKIKGYLRYSNLRRLWVHAKSEKNQIMYKNTAIKNIYYNPMDFI